MPTLVCVSILVHDDDAALADANAALRAGADLVEFRLDDLFAGSGEPDEIRRIVRLISASPLPCIATCRAAPEAGEEGGYDGDDDQRISLYERLGAATGPGEHPPRYIDLELATYTRSENIRQKVDLAVQHPGQVRELGTSLILSVHDFEGRPLDLSRRLLSMRSRPAAAVLKVAYRARSIRDCLDILDLCSESDRPMIALGMGEFGLMTRVLGPKFGAFLTYVSLRESSVTAPGQPTIDELLGMYRFRSIRRSTRVYGVIGWPAKSSMSRRVQNAGFDAFGGADGAGFDGVYLPLPIPDDEIAFKVTLGELLAHPRLTFSGCSVTLPHKENLVRFARERIAAGDERWSLDDLSDLCGAANTLAVERDSRGDMTAARVVNTDGPAAADSLEDALGSLKGARVAILGAGGAARAVAATLASRDAHVRIVNRTRERAQSLVDALRERYGDRVQVLDRAELGAWAPVAIVNCTPAGMNDGPAPGESPLTESEVAALAPGAWIFDSIYRPLETPLLRMARARGLPTIDGVTMFVRQGEAQFALWTGRPPAPGLFDRVTRAALAPPPARTGA